MEKLLPVQWLKHSAFSSYSMYRIPFISIAEFFHVDIKEEESKQYSLFEPFENHLYSLFPLYKYQTSKATAFFFSNSSKKTQLYTRVISNVTNVFIEVETLTLIPEEIPSILNL